MPMTTMSAKLLARAEAYERRAAALRLAAEELSGEEVTRAKERMNGHMSKAIALRETQRGRPVTRRQNGTERRRVARELLAGGEPISAKAAAEHLGVGRSYAQKLLADAGAVLIGQGHAAQWQLPSAEASTPAPPAAIPRAPKGRTRLHPSETQAAVLAVLQHARGPLTSTEITTVLRRYGYTMKRSQIVKMMLGVKGLRREGGGAHVRYALA